jgi:hypothetical protein
VTAEMLQRLETTLGVLNPVRTGDESWFYEHAPETARQSVEWHASQSQDRRERANKKQVKNQDNGHNFFESLGVVHKEFVPPGVIVNQTYYRQSLQRLRKGVIRVRPELQIIGRFIITTHPHLQHCQTVNFSRKIYSHVSAGSLLSIFVALGFNFPKK